MKALYVVLAVVGCGAPDSGGTGGGKPGTGGAGGGAVASSDEALSGSRLKNRYIQGEDGSRFSVGFFDSSRNEPCWFADADDGRKRCLPVELAASPIFFFDSACSERVLLLSGCAAVPKYAYTLSATCPSEYSLYAVGAVFTPTVGQLFQGSPMNCVQQNPANYSTATFYRVGAVIPASAFVAGEMKSD